MKIVGELLKGNGFEFSSINSKLKNDPQFLYLKDKKFHFFLVRASTYPDNPKSYDIILANKLKKQVQNFDIETYFAGVGFSNSTNHEDFIQKDKSYLINFDGWIHID